MSEMIEKVAAVLQKVELYDYHLTPSETLKLARAAIEAMREPTTAMVKAVYEPNIDYPRERCYEVMIDEALK